MALDSSEKSMCKIASSLSAFFIALGCNCFVFAQPSSHLSTSAVVNEDFFADNLFPLLKSAQCDLCHNDNGVASDYRIDFPGRNASREQIIAFGYSLREFVDRDHPQESLLLRKPTNRDEHTGGVRILPESEQEKTLQLWIGFLSKMSDQEQSKARERIERASRWNLQPLSIRRLTHSQYNNSIRDLLGDPSLPASRFPKEDFINGFKNQLEGQGVSPIQAEAYSEAAERLARSAFRGGDTRSLIPIQPSSTSDLTAAQIFIRKFGLKAFRRPLSEDEANKYLSMFLKESDATGEFNLGAQLVVEAMLQSPNFLFRIQRQKEPNYLQFEIASRLSYLIWDTMPDDEMLQAAFRNEYSTVAAIEKQTRRMLDDTRARVALDEFLAQWMRFDRVQEAIRDRQKYREFNSEVATAMTQETRQLFRHLVWNDKDFMEFFSADYSFISTSLAHLYNMPLPTEEFSQVYYPLDSGRSGVLGHGSFLVLTSKPADTSPTSRGLFVRNQFLSQEIAPPPLGVNSELPENTEDQPQTNRQRLASHLNSEACSGCHRLIDPIGYGFEQYDAIGRFHAKMNLKFGSRDKPLIKELDLDTSAFVQGIPKSEFSRPKELGKLLAKSETCQRCIVKQYFRYAFGREESPADQPILDAAFEKFRDSGFRFRELIMAVVTSKLFLQ